MRLTETDRKILESYDTLIDGLAAYFGDSCEIVLHSLEDYNNSVIKIVNGEHTNRSVGAPITNLALEMLNKITQNDSQTSIAYFTKNNKGEPLKSTTIAIRGEKKRIIGLLCINYYLNTPLYNFLSTFSYVEPQQGSGSTEIFTDNRNDLMDETIEDAKQKVFMDKSVLPSLKNKRVIELLNEQGFFNMKNSVEHVAKQLYISKNTVYMHLRNIK